MAALAEARHTGWDGLVAAQRAYLDEFWAGADVELEGDTELQQAVRFALFHTLQAAARAEGRAIPAKGLTGPGYDGHTFWDAERFVLPVLTYSAPQVARDALRWRHATLDLARERAAQLGLAGAVFPWRTIRGQECSGYWPAGTAAFHLGGAIADAVIRYHAGDRGRGVRARGRTGAAGRDRTALALARPPRPAGPLPHRRRHRARRVQRDRRQQRLHEPARAAEPARRGGRGGQTSASRRWYSAPTSRRRPPGATPPSNMVIPWDEELGVHPQSEGFTSHEAWDFERTAPGGVPAPPALPVLRHLPQAGREAGRPRARAAHLRRRLHRGGEGAGLRLLRAADRTGLVALRVHPGGRRRRGRPPRAGLRLLRRSRPDGPARPRNGTRATASTSPAWPASASPRSPASAACATTAVASASRLGCLRGSTASPSGYGSAAGGSRSRRRRRRRPTGCSTGRRSSSTTTARPWRSRPVRR